ncbi:MAG: sugar phosphate nucleotidyltransferase, partial [Gemmatimonadales bacterium]
GAGTRLRPLTDRLPKALVPVRGRPLLAHVMDRLVAAGATRIVVNTCRHAEQVAAYLERHAPPGVEVLLSHEPDGPYETGGGLLAAAPLFRGDGPILLHNVDVLSRIPLDLLLAAHRDARAATRPPLATLAVQDRGAARQLLFDDDGLMGRESRGGDGEVKESERVRESVGALRRWSFAGIHVVEPAIIELCERTGRFSIRTLYLDLARAGHRIHPVDVSAHEWLDVGTPERLAEAEARLE